MTYELIISGGTVIDGTGAVTVTAGELPGDYDDSVKSEWATPNQFDRPDGYDKSWLKYDEVDIFGNPR